MCIVTQMRPKKLLFKELKKFSKQNLASGNGLRVALLGDFATQLFKIALEGAAVALDVELEIFEADYDQVDLQILNPESDLYSFAPEWVIILNSNDVAKKIFYRTEVKEDFALSRLEKIETYYHVLQDKLGAKVILNNLAVELDEVFGDFWPNVSSSFRYQLQEYNHQLSSCISRWPNAFLLDNEALSAQVGLKEGVDNRMAINASMPFDLEFLAALAQSASSIIANQAGKFCKCLILDLDNTMWGGIIGDDGLEGIEVGDVGTGKAFQHLQFWAKSLKERGIILAVCSKNEEATAKEPFEKHPEMILKLSDISVFVANWQSKAENIKYIQSILNIGFDSMVFLDDNPMERDIVRKMLPEVIVPELPEDPSEYMSHIRSLNLFSTVNYSAADKDRTKQYQEEARRVKMQDSFESLDDYLAGLEMEAKIGAFDDFYRPRIAQLTQRSNQFNLRTIRYSEEEIRKIQQSEDYFSIYVVLKDKFGDYGLISNLVLKKKSNSMFIENWVMSCRVLKREVENLVINELVRLCQKNDCSVLVGEYIPTKKNVLVKDLYTSLDFKENSQGVFELEIENYKEKKHHIKITK